MFDEDLDAFPSVGGTAGGTGVSTQTVAMTQAVGTPFLTHGACRADARVQVQGWAFAATVAGVPRASARDFGGRNGARRRARALRARREHPRRRRCRPRVSPRARHRTRRGGGGAEAGEAGEGAVDVKPGAERAADAIVGALCALSGVDAGDETLADGSRAGGRRGTRRGDRRRTGCSSVPGPRARTRCGRRAGEPPRVAPRADRRARGGNGSPTPSKSPAGGRRARERSRASVRDPPRDAAALAAESTETGALTLGCDISSRTSRAQLDRVATGECWGDGRLAVRPGRAIRLPHPRAVFSRAPRVPNSREFFQPPLAGAPSRSSRTARASCDAPPDET